MLMKLLGVLCAIAATGTVLVYGFGLQVQRPITPLQAKQEAPLTTPKAPQVASSAPIHAPAETQSAAVELAHELAHELPQEQLQVEAQAQEELQEELQEEVQEQAHAPLVDIPATAEITVAAEQTSGEPAAAELTEAVAEQVFVFWQPFLSRGSAQGFAQGLSARAQVPVNVISEETDSGRHYRVVLPYDSEAQRMERLAKLESATRLEMGE